MKDHSAESCKMVVDKKKRAELREKGEDRPIESIGTCLTQLPGPRPRAPGPGPGPRGPIPGSTVRLVFLPTSTPERRGEGIAAAQAA